MSAKGPQRKKRKKYMGMTGLQIVMLFAVGGALCLALGIGAMLILPTLTNNPAPTTVASLSPTPTPTRRPPTDTPNPTATFTPRPTNTRVVVAQASPTPNETATPFMLPTLETSGAIGTLEVDFWLFQITQAVSKPGDEPDQQVVILMGRLTNQSAKKASFDTAHYLKLRDAGGNEYPADEEATQQVITDYALFDATNIVAKGTITFVVAFVTPVSEKSYTIIPGKTTLTWSGDINFSIP